MGPGHRHLPRCLHSVLAGRRPCLLHRVRGALPAPLLHPADPEPPGADTQGRVAGPPACGDVRTGGCAAKWGPGPGQLPTARLTPSSALTPAPGVWGLQLQGARYSSMDLPVRIRLKPSRLSSLSSVLNDTGPQHDKAAVTYQVPSCSAHPVPPPPPGTRGSNWRDSCSSCTDHRVPGSARWLPFCPGVGVGRPPDAPLLSRGPGPKPPTPPSGKEQEDTWGRVLLRQCPPGSKVTNGWIKR